MTLRTLGRPIFGLLCLLVLGCGSSTGEATRPCPVGYFEAPLGGCAIDPKHPPCECVDLATVSCCSGDVCCRPGDAECDLGTAVCESGVVSCRTNASDTSGFLLFKNLCQN